jgi:nucleoside transporter
MTPGLRIRLSAMMFLEFFVWGAWYGVLLKYLSDSPPTGLGFSDTQGGNIYSLLPLASIFMPLLAGQLTDRLVPTQIFLGIAHLLGAGGLYLAAKSTDYTPVWGGILIWAIAYAPTISLTNSLAFSHVKDPEKDFGGIRVLGTIGWIAAGWVLAESRAREGIAIGGNDCLYLGAVSSLVMGLLCFALPHTPPAKTGVSPWAFLKALRLLKNPRIAVFLLVSLVVAVEFPFYFMFTDPFLQHLGVAKENTPRLLTIAQFAEIFTMLALPWFLKRLGPRKTLFLGVLAWPARYLVFAIGTPFWLVVAALALHGICFVFFFVVAFIYIDSVAPKDIRASAQGLLTLVIYGLGMFFGSLFAAAIKAHFTTSNPLQPDSTIVNWTGIFLVPSVLTIACALVLFVTFPRGSMQEVSAAPEPVSAA